MTRDVHAIRPLLDIHNAQFREYYELGLWWSMYGDREEFSHTPMHDTYLVTNLKILAAHNFFDGEHKAELSQIGFFVGMLHGGVLDSHE